MTVEEPSHQVTGLILCGGRARRLGGVDKGLFPVAGRPLVEHVLDRVVPQVETVLINANRSRDRYAGYGYPVVADENANFDGPLAGVLAGLRVCRTPWLVTVPCDAPRFPVDLVERLLQGARLGEALTACAFDGERLQPTFCLYHMDLLPQLETYLASGERKIDRFLFKWPMVKVNCSDQAQTFVNLNSPEDIEHFEATAGSR